MEVLEVLEVLVCSEEQRLVYEALVAQIESLCHWWYARSYQKQWIAQKHSCYKCQVNIY